MEAKLIKEGATAVAQPEPPAEPPPPEPPSPEPPPPEPPASATVTDAPAPRKKRRKVKRKKKARARSDQGGWKASPASRRQGHHPPMEGRYLASMTLLALGVVFGDIGTSPLYAMRECFHHAHGLHLSQANVFGVLSLIFWSLTIVVSIKYLVYVMRADNRGEGGILALMALAMSDLAGGPKRSVVIMLGLFGAAFLYGDGVITPAISVLGAVEGLNVAAPVFGDFVVPITIVILVLLFSIQKRGTASVGRLFGPITLLWFTVLAVLGIAHIAAAPEILAALNPYYAARFFIDNGWVGFLVLGSVFLVVTGGEALYADMGHFGLKPIRLAWFALVLPALVLNYFGQGALLLRSPEAISNPFYLLAPSWALYPMVILATLAAIIASQALISGAFSITRQAVMLGYFPRVKIEHTSAKEIGQIYVPAINWILLGATIAIVLAFRSSSNLAAAYGIAVTSTMIITALLAYVVARHLWGWGVPAAASVTALFLIADAAFFGANVIKLLDGGWVPVLLAAAIFTCMATWKRGREVLGERIRASIVPLEDLFEVMHIERPARVPGTALFLSSNPTGTPPALMHNLLHNRVVHKQVVLLTVQTTEAARIRSSERVRSEDIGNGFVRIVARYGFMEEPDIPALLARDDTPTPPIDHTTIFVGRETVLAEGGSGMAKWREHLFAAMTRNATQATAFFHIPRDRVFEVGTQIEL